MRDLLEFILQRSGRTHVTENKQNKSNANEERFYTKSLLLLFIIRCGLSRIFRSIRAIRMCSISRYVSLRPISVLNCVSAYGAHATHMDREHCTSHTDRILIRNETEIVLTICRSYREIISCKLIFIIREYVFVAFFLALGSCDATIFNLFFILASRLFTHADTGFLLLLIRQLIVVCLHSPLHRRKWYNNIIEKSPTEKWGKAEKK